MHQFLDVHEAHYTKFRLPNPCKCTVDPIPDDEFKAGQVELAQDLIMKVQQIEMIISTLPGLENNAQDQERYIRELEEELRAAEAQRQDAIREMTVVQERLDQVVKGTMRP